MKQEDKDLLLKELCARLPYGIKIQYEDGIFTIDHISAMYEEVKLNTPNKYTIDVLDIKPYLFPMSSMTSEQLHEIQSILGDDCKIENDFIRIVNSERNTLSYQEIKAVFNYCYKNHLDINGLIPRGLGIDVTGLNIY